MAKRSHDRVEGKPDVILEKRCKYYWDEDGWDDEADESPAPAPGTKRRYERDEEKRDVIFEKRYKSNRWEDPAYARHLQRWGSRLAQSDALDIDTQHFLKEMHATILARAASAGHP